MKRIWHLAAGIALVLAFSMNDSRAQDQAPAPGPAPATNAAPAPVPRFQNNPNRFAVDDPNQPQLQRLASPRFRQARPMLARTVGDLRIMKMELQRMQGDLDGHKDTAIEACDKAMQELLAVMKALPPPPSPRRIVPSPLGAAPAPAPVQAVPPTAAPAPAPVAPSVQSRP